MHAPHEPPLPELLPLLLPLPEPLLVLPLLLPELLLPLLLLPLLLPELLLPASSKPPDPELEAVPPSDVSNPPVDESPEPQAARSTPPTTAKALKDWNVTGFMGTALQHASCHG